MITTQADLDALAVWLLEFDPYPFRGETIIDAERRYHTACGTLRIAGPDLLRLASRGLKAEQEVCDTCANYVGGGCTILGHAVPCRILGCRAWAQTKGC
jgi:hypothetical protein